MAIPEAKYKVGIDRSPLGPTTVIEVYEVEGEDSLGYVHETESIESLLKSKSEEEGFEDENTSVFELEPEESRFRFELDPSESRSYEKAFREAYINREPEFGSIDDALFTVELFTSPSGGVEKNSYIARFTEDNVPEEIIKAFSSLHRTAYENTID